MARNIKTTVPYITHIIRSYDKHYITMKVLEPIVATGEESALDVTCSKIEYFPEDGANSDRIIENGTQDDKFFYHNRGEDKHLYQSRGE